MFHLTSPSQGIGGTSGSYLFCRDSSKIPLKTVETMLGVFPMIPGTAVTKNSSQNIKINLINLTWLLIWVITSDNIGQRWLNSGIAMKMIKKMNRSNRFPRISYGWRLTYLSLPTVGLMEATPLKWAGILKLPPISVPVPNMQPWAPTKLPVPELDPPGVSFGFVAFSVLPNTGLSLP